MLSAEPPAKPAGVGNREVPLTGKFLAGRSWSKRNKSIHTSCLAGCVLVALQEDTGSLPSLQRRGLLNVTSSTFGNDSTDSGPRGGEAPDFPLSSDPHFTGGNTEAGAEAVRAQGTPKVMPLSRGGRTVMDTVPLPHHGATLVQTSS